jgi:putative sigma-54 modulation protein
MKTTITARNMVVTPGITNRIMKKTNRMERYLHPETELTVRLGKEQHGRRTVELTVPVGGMILRAEAFTEDNLYLAIDQALAKLEKQIHRHRTKLEKRMRSDAFREAELEYIEEAEFSVPEEGRKIVRYKTFPVRPMSLEDAMLQMDLLSHSFFVFVNQETDRTNVLYLRKDGDLGLLEPDA